MSEIVIESSLPTVFPGSACHMVFTPVEEAMGEAEATSLPLLHRLEIRFVSPVPRGAT